MDLSTLSIALTNTRNFFKIRYKVDVDVIKTAKALRELLKLEEEENQVLI